jgi:uncharacterized lipoprotein YehR (DUF1307 family)
MARFFRGSFMKNLKSVLALVMALVIAVCLTGCGNGSFNKYFTDVSVYNGYLSMTLTEYASKETKFLASTPVITAYVGEKSYYLDDVRKTVEIDRMDFIFHVKGIFEGLTEKPDRIVVEFSLTDDKRIEVTKKF